MKQFKYVGEQAHNSTIRVSGGVKDLRLAPGDQATLPEDNPVIKALVSRGLLIEVKATTTKKTENVS